jgi:hypothetical protein
MDNDLQFGVEELPLRHESSVHIYSVGRVHLRQNPGTVRAQFSPLGVILYHDFVCRFFSLSRAVIDEAQ